jgi:hypothetical protein
MLSLLVHHIEPLGPGDLFSDPIRIIELIQWPFEAFIHRQLHVTRSPTAACPQLFKSCI